MELQLIFLLIKLHFVICIPQLHEYAATYLHHSRIRSPSSIAFPPSESLSGLPHSIALPPSKASSRNAGSIALSPSKSFPKMKWTHSSMDSPISHHKHRHSRRKSNNQVPGPTYPIHPHTHQGSPVFKYQHSFSSPMSLRLNAPTSAPAPAPASSPTVLSHHLNVPSPSPRISPPGSSLKKTETPPPAYTLVLPSPPPNKDCISVTCSEPLTYTPPGSPCGCVWPLQVKLRINIATYKFFPLVSKLANEIAASVLLNHNQVRVVGADATSQQLEKTIVLINLVPQGVKFDDTTAFLIYKKFWQREVLNDASAFGDYEVLYVHYPGLPPSPPSNVHGIDVEPYPGRRNDGTIVKPLGVDVSGKKKEGSGGRMVIMIVLSSFAAFVLFIGVAWLCLLKCGSCTLEPEQIPDVKIPFSSKRSGLCTEKQTRCLVYELVPNGSVESHLHGADKETEPLDWDARMKIALGAARGLAYLHEDCNPCVIHRDFKSSNILLEYDFTPKVSDFGLARTTLNEGSNHISTHVIGTFGYVAPEYAMTGHLLVKSDVYSYGVVLLELLTGRKPVDLSQPPGQENLVAWARPLLTSKEGLQKIIDPIIKPVFSVDTMVKVAAIASMCVQPEVTQRPFMGEVVQALKLVCSEFEETSYVRLKSFREDDLATSVPGERVGISECNITLPQPG
ncbi:hypothetical protein JHK85_041851 [Glycine max]|nr:hypothetical protein JHK85_041851 [Glycine max]